MREERYDITGIIRDESITTHYQPIVSIKKNSIIGFEALTRGLAPGGEIISPTDLFARAAEAGLTLDLDRLCRKKALEGFMALELTDSEYILSVNIDPAALEEGQGSGNLEGMVLKNAMQPGRLLIEVTESSMCGLETLERFVTYYRSRGYLIALDDVGAGFSSLERISIIRPDVLKIDCALTARINNGHHSRETIHALVSLAHKTGSLVIAEGVETEEQVLAALELGVDMLQGYYFSRPIKDVASITKDMEERIVSIAQTSKNNIVTKINRRKAQHKSYSQIVNDFVAELSKVEEEIFDATLQELVKRYPVLECAYILDANGIQSSSTVFSADRLTGPQDFFFQPAQKGADQSSKDYYFLVASGLLKYTTGAYISLASRHICITISVAFRDLRYGKRILCLDIVQEENPAPPAKG
jgi:EAL domain-containing protein (putative c-di-GMP-specific phosphodiesterase class I)